MGTEASFLPTSHNKSQDDGRFERLCLKMPSTNAIKMSPYAKYMEDIVCNNRNICTRCINAMKLPEKKGDLGIPTIPCSIKKLCQICFV
jgi:hypothetical protein